MSMGYGFDEQVHVGLFVLRLPTAAASACPMASAYNFELLLTQTQIKIVLVNEFGSKEQ